MATQHPEQERLSMRARPELGQMQTKHMSPWQPSKNKIERVREAGGTRISSNRIEHTYVRITCVRFVVSSMDRWNKYRLYFSCYCAFPESFGGSHPFVWHVWLLHPIPIQSVPAQLKFQSMKLERMGRFCSTLRHLHPSSFQILMWLYSNQLLNHPAIYIIYYMELLFTNDLWWLPFSLGTLKMRFVLALQSNLAVLCGAGDLDFFRPSLSVDQNILRIWHNLWLLLL